MGLTEKQIAVDNFHKHLDNCKQCEQNPFDLCYTGKQLLANTFSDNNKICE
jgi:hypothetical protein